MPLWGLPILRQTSYQIEWCLTIHLIGFQKVSRAHPPTNPQHARKNARVLEGISPTNTENPWKSLGLYPNSSAGSRGSSRGPATGSQGPRWEDLEPKMGSWNDWWKNGTEMVRSFGDCFCKYLLGVFAMILFKYVQIISVFHLDRQYKFSKQDEHLNRGGSPSNNGWRLSIVFGCASALASLAPQIWGLAAALALKSS